MRRIIILLAFATLAGALVFGAAATLGVSSANLGSGSQTVAACDGNGVDVSYQLNTSDPTKVEAVVVSDIDIACDTQLLWVVVSNDSSGTLDSGSVTIDHTTNSGTETIDLTTDPNASAIDDAAVTITG